MSTSDELGQRFKGLKGVSFRTTGELGISNGAGLDCVVIENGHGRVVVALHGAHVLSYVPAGKSDVLWLSPASNYADGMAIRGGIPLCAPWFGPHPAGLPQHGYARITKWTVEDISVAASETVLTLALPACGDTGLGWKRDFAMRLNVTLGSVLGLEFAAVNHATESRKLEFAYHTYFAVGDAAKASVTGVENCVALNRLDNDSEYVQRGPVKLALPAGLTALYLDPPSTQILSSPAGTYRVESRSGAALVWNPGDAAAKVADIGADRNLGFLCLERLDAVGKAVTLAPGARYELTMTLASL